MFPDCSCRAVLVLQVPLSRIQTRMLPVSEAGPNPGAALVTFATTGRFKVMVLGSRGLGSVSSSLQRRNE